MPNAADSLPPIGQTLQRARAELDMIMEHTDPRREKFEAWIREN